MTAAVASALCEFLMESTDPTGSLKGATIACSFRRHLELGAVSLESCIQCLHVLASPSLILSIKTSFPPRNYLPPLNFEQRGVARRVNVSVAALSQSLIDNDTLGKVNKTQRVETKLQTHHGLSHDFFSSKLQETQ